ncbi:MAG: acyl carrier protein [Oscillospiraceae bacterium]|nr:acyl carrier protein [Oscillospiraceae bacterium]MBP5744242.1 acyl carrier protein [Oscillospiraceae bacterium]
MEETIKEILSEVSGVPVPELREDTRLVGDLGMSSFDLADLVVSVEEAYGIKIPDESFHELETVADIARVIRERSEP